jgi:hypothetical protein
VDELVVEVYLPEKYPAPAKAIIEKNGVEVDPNQFNGKFEFSYDALVNLWTLKMRNPPAQHGIFIRWDLPEEWEENEPGKNEPGG